MTDMKEMHSALLVGLWLADRSDITQSKNHFSIPMKRTTMSTVLIADISLIRVDKIRLLSGKILKYCLTYKWYGGIMLSDGTFGRKCKLNK